MISWVPPRHRNLVAGLALVVAVFAAYAMSLRGDFLWDDDLHVTANPTIVGPLGLREIWTTARANYFPLVLTNFRVQHALWGLNPAGYHAVTIACHALAALLLWRVLCALNVRGGWLGAALWALHPVQVESVAWIAELKNTQSAVFFLAAILFWIRWLEICGHERERVDGHPPARPASSAPRAGREAPARSRKFFGFALLCGLLAILSKPSTVMLPVALALCGWWWQRRISWRDLLSLAPFFALSALAAGWTIWEQKHHSGALGPEWSQTAVERVLIAGRVVWFYLGKLAWPDPLVFIYPRWQIDAAQPLGYVPVIAAAIGLGWLAWRSRTGLKPVAFAAGYFVALLFPVLGFFSVYFFRYSFVGDHFQYLASMGPLALAAAGLRTMGPSWRTRLATSGPANAPATSYFSMAVAALVLIACGVLTLRQSRAYRSNEALWRDTLAQNPEATMAWLNLADTLAQAGRYEESMATYRRALQLAPRDPDGWNDLGNVLVLLGQPEPAVRHFERALALKSDFPEAHSNYGNALRLLGRSEEAMAHYRRALELQPRESTRVDALNNLGAELAESGHAEEALPYFEAALRLAPKHAGAHDNLANALRALGKIDDALAQHAAALRLEPISAEAEANYARTLVAAGRVTEALPHFERALQLKPNLATARGNYAMALARSGRTTEALAQLERAVQLSPDSAEAHHNLGTALAQSRRLDDALAEFEAAVRLAPQFVLARVSVATALGAKGRWSAAIPHLRAVLEREPRHPAALAQLAVALVNTGELGAAVPVFEQALQVQPASAELHNNFAQLLRALGRNREALEHFETAADLERRQRR